MRWIKDLERWKLLVKEAKEKSASTRDGEPPLVEQTASHSLIPFHFSLSDSDGSTWSELDPTAICNLWIVTSLTLGYAYVVPSSTFERRCVCPFRGCRFIGTYRKLYVHASSGHSDDLQMIECGETRANSASSELPPEPFVVPSFMGPATEISPVSVGFQWCLILPTVWDYVEKSPVGIIIKFMDVEFAWSSTLVHYFLSRQLYCKKQHEIWFLIEKQPARFSLFEFEDITCLNCEPLPNTMVVEDVEKSNNFWALFNLRRTGSTPSAEDIRTLCRSPDVYRSWSREDQIRLCYLAILTGGLLALDRREAIPPAKAKLLMDLEIFEQYPCGRVAFVELVQQIKDATATKIKDDSYVCKGFVQVIQVWAYAYIPCLGEAIGRPIRSNGPCLLRFKGKYGKLPLGSILEKAKVYEVHPVWEQEDEDPEIDNLLEFLRQDNSLSTITWQALPEYPLTPIECNKRRRVASQWKSKKSKKVASNEQENIADGSEKRGDIAETEEQVQIDDGDGNFFIQRRKNPEILFHTSTRRLASAKHQSQAFDKEASKEGENMVKRKGKATDVGEPEIGEDYDTIKSPHVSMEEEDDRLHEEAAQALKGDEDESLSASSNIITSSKPIKRSARIAALSEKLNTNYLVVYGPVDKEKVRALNAFIKEKGDSTYPPGNVFTAKEFFQTFMKPRSWLSFVDLDVPIAMYRVSQYKEWLGDQSNIPKGVYDYYSENSHWVMMVISIPDRTIEIYDSMTGLIPMEIITQAAIPFAHMVPYVLYACSDPEVKQVMDTTMYSIQFVTDGVPQINPPYGDCGIYAVKFIECLVMGVAFADEHLRKPFLRNASPASFKEFFSIVNFIVLFTSASYSSLFQGNTCFSNFYHKPYQAMPVQASLPRTRKPCFLKPVLLPSKLFILLTGEYYGVPSQFVFGRNKARSSEFYKLQLHFQVPESSKRCC
ncbi:hypothetical protein F2Q69_00035395 [Brassica cretica]|uniref:Ubiquitin-like protease family profile domain-containing protein n=1 Tax=Brassica cretica TaxID=69181 RepID=A0A8S9SPS4_BRACR|nr:hypothetical protein F2Q69_00035395 [Brassica cretica]